MLRAAHQKRAVFAAALALEHPAGKPRNSVDDSSHQVRGFRACTHINGFARLNHLAFDFVGFSHTLHNALNALCHPLVDFAGGAAHLGLHKGVHGRDVAAFARPERPHGHTGVTLAVTGNALHHERAGSRGHQGASAFIGV